MKYETIPKDDKGLCVGYQLNEIANSPQYHDDIRFSLDKVYSTICCKHISDELEIYVPVGLINSDLTIKGNTDKILDKLKDNRFKSVDEYRDVVNIHNITRNMYFDEATRRGILRDTFIFRMSIDQQFPVRYTCDMLLRLIDYIINAPLIKPEEIHEFFKSKFGNANIIDTKNIKFTYKGVQVRVYKNGKVIMNNLERNGKFKFMDKLNDYQKRRLMYNFI